MKPLSKISSHIINNEFEEAYYEINNYESEYKDNAEYWNLKGLLCLKVGEYKTALGCLEKAIMIDYRNGDVLYNYAFALERMDNRSDAALYYGLAYRYTNDKELKNELSSFYDNQTDLKNIFKIASVERNKTFIILSSCGWGDVYQRMHHIARSLAKFGHEIIYVSPSESINIDIDSISESELINYSLHNVKIVDGVKIYTPISLIRDQKLYISNYKGLTQSLLDSTRFNQKVIISYLPYQINIVNSLKGDYFHIYECVDDHTDLEYAFWGKPKDVIWEQQLMDKADAITTTATSLFLQRYVIEGRNNVFMSRNAVNERDFIFNEQEEEVPADLKDIPLPRIVFTGVVYQRFDEKLFYEIVESNPDKSFVIIGPVHEGMLTKKYNNLFLLGPKKHSTLISYLKHMQIGIVPYVDDADMDIACDSIKQYEYTACSLPVITTYMPESGINKIYTYLANTKDNFNEAIIKCLNLEMNSNIISDYIAKNSWNERAAFLCKIADNLIDEVEKYESYKKLGESIENLIDNYNQPTFLILKAIYEELNNNSKEFEIYAKKAYELKRLKFIEKYYLLALIKNENLLTFNNVVLNSTFIKEEIKQELLYRIKINDYDCITSISYLCVGDFNNFLTKNNEIKNETDRLLYQAYFNYIINNDFNIQIFNLININIDSPLYQFLVSS